MESNVKEKDSIRPESVRTSLIRRSQLRKRAKIYIKES